MLSITIAASKHDKAFWQAIKTTLENNFSVIYACERQLIVNGDKPEMIIADIGSFDAIQTDETIIIFKDKLNINIDSSSMHNVIAVVDSSNEKLMRFVAATKLPAVTCGLSARDTITLSSISRDSAVISLQRSVVCLDGTQAEPQEIPVNICSICDNFALMAIASIYILSGKTEYLSNIKIHE